VMKNTLLPHRSKIKMSTNMLWYFVACISVLLALIAIQFSLFGTYKSFLALPVVLIVLIISIGLLIIVECMSKKKFWKVPLIMLAFFVVAMPGNLGGMDLFIRFVNLAIILSSYVSGMRHIPSNDSLG